LRDSAGGYLHFGQGQRYPADAPPFLYCSDASLAQYSGQLDAISFLVDYKFAKRFDAYAGIMWSEVSNGLANGFLQRSSIDPTVGMRFQF
jgi:predicted porin